MEGFRSSRINAVWIALALAFAVRALVPAGWMPADLTGGSVLMPCPTDVAMARVFGDVTAPAPAAAHAMHGGEMADTSSGDTHDAPPCAFTALAVDAPQSPFADLPQPPLPEAQRAIPVRAAIILARLSRERPPGRAPPVIA